MKFLNKIWTRIDVKLRKNIFLSVTTFFRRSLMQNINANLSKTQNRSESPFSRYRFINIFELLKYYKKKKLWFMFRSLIIQIKNPTEIPRNFLMYTAALGKRREKRKSNVFKFREIVNFLWFSGTQYTNGIINSILTDLIWAHLKDIFHWSNNSCLVQFFYLFPPPSIST